MKRTLHSVQGASQDKEEPKLKRIDKTNSFSVNSVLQNDCKFPCYRQPHEIGRFSLGSNLEYLDSSSVQLKYLCRPAENCVSFNLRLGYSHYISKDETVKQYIDHILKWILKNKSTFSVSVPVPHSGDDYCEK